MELLDEEGNLFGVVNVVDALVVLLVIAVVVAGLAVVGLSGDDGDPDDGEPATRYATVDLGEQPEYVAEEIEAGDRMVTSGQRFTLTDVYRSGGADPNETHVVVRGRVEGTLRSSNTQGDSVFHFAGRPMQISRQVTIDTAEYSRSGRVTSIDEAGDSLRTNETHAVIETTVPEHTADAIEVGDRHRFAGDTVATVETVRSYPIGDNRRRVQLGVALRTIQESGRSTFGSRPVSVGNSLDIYTDAYEINGTVIRKGALEPRGEESTTTVELELERVEPERVQSLGPGATETERGRTLATINSISTEPAVVILESDDGNIYAREHPTKVDVTIEADLSTRKTDTGLRFHGKPLRQDQAITLDFDTVQVSGNVTSIQSP